MGKTPTENMKNGLFVNRKPVFIADNPEEYDSNYLVFTKKQFWNDIIGLKFNIL